MNIDILTLFPKMFDGPFNESIIKRAQEKNLVNIKIHNLRDWARDKHKTTDDTPYGGGAGMVMKVDVIDLALRDLKFKTPPTPQGVGAPYSRRDSRDVGENSKLKTKVILLTPQGKTFTQKKAKSLMRLSNIILICGHYEGFDERVRYLVDEQISIGDYVLTGGEIPAMVVVDVVSRLIPGVLGKNQSHQIETFSMSNMIKKNENCKMKIENLIYEYPQYTRPLSYKPIFKNYKKSLSVPRILLSGNHQKIHQWRVEQSVKKSKK